MPAVSMADGGCNAPSSPLTFGDVSCWLTCEVHSYDTSSQNLVDHFAAFNAR